MPHVERSVQPEPPLSVAAVARTLTRGAMFILLSIAATIGYWAAFAFIVIGTTAAFIFGGRLLAAIGAWFLGAL